MGIADNTGRIVSAAAPYLVGRASQQGGLGAALGMTSIAFLSAACIAIFLPETLRKPLT